MVAAGVLRKRWVEEEKKQIPGGNDRRGQGKRRSRSLRDDSQKGKGKGKGKGRSKGKGKGRSWLERGGSCLGTVGHCCGAGGGHK